MLVEDDVLTGFLADSREAIGRTVRAERKRPIRDWSQDALATRMRGLGHPSWRQTTVAKVEGGSRPVSLDEAVSLAFALALPSLEFLFGSEHELNELLVRNYTERHRAEMTKAWQGSLDIIKDSNPDAVGAITAAMEAAETLIYAAATPDELKASDFQQRVNEAMERATEEYRRGVDREA